MRNKIKDFLKEAHRQLKAEAKAFQFLYVIVLLMVLFSVAFIVFGLCHEIWKLFR